jgi:hypothetical protein
VLGLWILLGLMNLLIVVPAVVYSVPSLARRCGIDNTDDVILLWVFAAFLLVVDAVAVLAWLESVGWVVIGP